MITIAQYGTLMEAELLKLKLASCGIDAFIPDELTAGVAPHIFAPRSGIRVQDADKDLKMSESLWLLRQCNQKIRMVRMNRMSYFRGFLL